MDKTAKKNSIFLFDFWQKFGKALMVVIAVMPAAGLMISIGKLLSMNFEAGIIVAIANIMDNIGWAIIGNLHILFAAAIGGSWAKERAGGAFAAVLVNRITGAIVYNKYYNYDKLPQALSFFNGKRFVLFVVILWSTITGVAFSLVWPVIQGALNDFGQWIATSQDTAPILAPFVYGTLERLLLPFGLHHMLTVPMNYTELGGVYTVLTGAAAGTTVAGQDPLWFAWITDLVNLKAAGDTAAYNELLATVTPARFKVGQVFASNASLIGIAYAMYKNVDKDKKKPYKSMFFSSALADVLHLRIHAFGSIELLTRIPMIFSAGIAGDLLNFAIVSVVLFLLNFGVFSFLIKKLNITTPGRNGNYIDDEESAQASKSNNKSVSDEQVTEVIRLLGGKENIVDVDACMTRLRVTVKDTSIVGDQAAWKQNGALGLIIKDKGIQAIYGPKADVLKLMFKML